MRTRTLTTMLAATALALPATALAAPPGDGPAFPDVVDLPDGFQPEGIAIGGGPVAYAGSLADGDIVRVDLRSGELDYLVSEPGPGVDGDDQPAPAVGLGLDPAGRVLAVANGPSGTGSFVDTRTGELETVDLAPGFVNDVVQTRDAAWFTNSNSAEIYRVALGPDGFPTGDVRTLTVGGDFELVEGFNLNGIDVTADGSTLVVVQSATGTLFTVDPDTGIADAVELTDATGEGRTDVTNGDGILLRGRELLVVQNQDNEVTTVELDGDLASGVVTERVTQDAFPVPTTVASLGSSDYVVNAAFGSDPATTAYTLVRVER